MFDPCLNASVVLHNVNLFTQQLRQKLLCWNFTEEYSSQKKTILM